MNLNMSRRDAETIVDALPHKLLVLRESGDITFANAYWRKSAFHNEIIGAKYLAICDATTGIDSEWSVKMAVAIREAKLDSIKTFEVDYSRCVLGETRYYLARVRQILLESGIHILITHENTTVLKELSNISILQGAEKTKRADELVIANAELAFQGAEKTKRAEELVIANAELAFQGAEKTKRADELVIAKMAAETATLSKSVFLANMSHEIRTPLNGVLGLLELLIRTKLNKPQLDYAEKAERCAISLLRILNDVLDFSKVEAGKMILDPEPFNVTMLLNDLDTILRSNLRGKPLSLIIDVDPLVPAIVIGDGSRINQVLINLGGNAIKFTAQGEVRVRVLLKHLTAREAVLAFEVTDTGIGLLPEQQVRIFESFAQADVSTSRKFGGTGLGLSISQRLLGLMESKLQVRSEFGRGSSFYFDLTLKLPSVSLTELTHVGPLKRLDTTSFKLLKDLRVLVAEDNLINQVVVKTMLEQEGATVTLVENGQLAIDALFFSPTDFDVVLMDVQMPIMDGLTATRLIRQQLELTKLPIIAMTANVMPLDRQNCILAGMDGHIGKPFNINRLVELLQEYKALMPS